MNLNISEDEKRKRIRNYFHKPKLKWPLIITFLGLLISTQSSIGLIVLVGGGLWLFLLTVPFFGAPGDQKIDAWLIDDIEKLKQRSLERLDIDPSEIIRNSVVIRGPILWETRGVPSKDLAWKKGKDKYIRFSTNAVTIVHFTEHKLSSYQCAYNSMRGVPLNEQDDEFFYRDVVAVSTRDDATNYTLPNGRLMKQAQLFKLSVSGGDNIRVIVNSADIVDFTGGSIAETGLDSAVKTLRRVLRERKL